MTLSFLIFLVLVWLSGRSELSESSLLEEQGSGDLGVNRLRVEDSFDVTLLVATKVECFTDWKLTFSSPYLKQNIGMVSPGILTRFSNFGHD